MADDALDHYIKSASEIHGDHRCIFCQTVDGRCLITRHILEEKCLSCRINQKECSFSRKNGFTAPRSHFLFDDLKHSVDEMSLSPLKQTKKDIPDNVDISDYTLPADSKPARSKLFQKRKGVHCPLLQDITTENPPSKVPLQSDHHDDIANNKPSIIHPVAECHRTSFVTEADDRTPQPVDPKASWPAIHSLPPLPPRANNNQIPHHDRKRRRALQRAYRPGNFGSGTWDADYIESSTDAETSSDEGYVHLVVRL